MQDREQASIHKAHASSDSQSEITNQAHSTSFPMSKQPENADFLRQFRSQRLIETIG